MTLNTDIMPFIQEYKQMREALYNGADEISASIVYTPVTMAPELISFKLTTQDKTLDYTHGPILNKKPLGQKIIKMAP